jgi:hypothetical protein
MTVVTRHRTTLVSDTWCDRVWPVLAGATVAVGLLGTWRLIGLLPGGLVIAGLWLFFAVVLYGAGSESGLRPSTAFRIGMVAAVSIVALLGLTDLFPASGWFAALAVGVSSPFLLRHLAVQLRRGAKFLAVRTSRESTADQAAVDSTFERIVANLDGGDA